MLYRNGCHPYQDCIVIKIDFKVPDRNIFNSGLRRRFSLLEHVMDKKFKREITGVLLLKAVVIFCIWAIWFAHPEDEALDAAQVSAKLFTQHIPRESK